MAFTAFKPASISLSATRRSSRARAGAPIATAVIFVGRRSHSTGLYRPQRSSRAVGGCRSTPVAPRRGRGSVPRSARDKSTDRCGPFNANSTQTSSGRSSQDRAMAKLRELPPWACDLIGFNRAEGVSSDIAAGADTLGMNDRFGSVRWSLSRTPELIGEMDVLVTFQIS